MPVEFQALSVSFKLDKVFCHAQSDPAAGTPVGFDADSEPFLLTYFFAVDGGGVTLNAALKLEGEARVHPTPGTHGNLGDGSDSVAAGEFLQIPPAIGHWATLFQPITLPDPCDVLLPGGVPGGIGVVCALMEQGLETPEGMDAAHKAFDDTLTAILNFEVIPSISLETGGQITDEQKQQFAAKIEQEMREALVSEQAKQPLRNETTSLEPPDLLGFELFTFTHADWIAETPQPPTKTINARFNAKTGAPAGNDWEITGTVTAAPPCSALTIARAGAGRPGAKPVLTPDHMKALRRFRDRELVKRPHARGWLSLVGDRTPEIAAVLDADPELRERAQRALAAVAQATEGDGRIEPEHFETAQLVLERVRKRAPSPRSRRQLALLSAALKRMSPGTVSDLLEQIPTGARR